MVCASAAVLFLLFGAELSLALPADLHQQTIPQETPSWGNPLHHKDKWNVLYHQGGNGPWIRKIDGVLPGGLELPEGCQVDMVHGMSRHGERYPTIGAGYRMISLIDRLKEARHHFNEDLEFLNDWEFFTGTPDAHFEQLTSTGPYAGVLETFKTGVLLKTRYQHLWNDNVSDLTYVWAADDTRVIDTARHFAAGFFGLDSKAAGVQVIPETFDRGANTLTPGKTCRKNLSDAKHGRINGYIKLKEYASTYLSDIAARLEKHNPRLNLTDDEVFTMQQFCGFETTVRGSSPWCDVFTPKEWEKYEYARDVIHFYRSGPGNKYSRVMGGLWLNATTELLLDGPAKRGPLFFSFVHDGDLVPLLSALGILGHETSLPVTHLKKDRRWRTSDVAPMGGRIIFERLSCADDEKFIRININDGIVPLDDCQSGPNKSCPLGDFANYVRKRQEEAGDFKEVCGLEDDKGPDVPTFLRQPAFEKGEDRSGVEAGGHSEEL